MLTLKVLRRESPSLRVGLRRSISPEKRLRGNTECVSRSSPSYILRALICVIALLTLLEHSICLRGCDTQPSDVLGWPRSLPGNTACAEVGNELVAEFQKVEMRR
jgi:hypothetical protein